MEIGPAAPLSSPVADDPNTRREEKVEEGMEITMGTRRRFDSETLTILAEGAERMKRIGEMPSAPPFEVVDYPEFFERAWGWDLLLPYDLVTPVPIYKRYLRQYYIRNHQRGANAAGADDLGLDGDDHGNGLLASLAKSCIAMEDRLIFEWNHRAKSFTIDDDEMEVRLMSGNITKRAREMVQVPESEFPAAAIALIRLLQTMFNFKCITKEAELLCQCIISRKSVISFMLSNAVRRCALSFMICKDNVPAAATMMGIMKEAERAIKWLRGDQVQKFARTRYIDHLRRRAIIIMLELWDELAAVAEPTVGDIAGDLSSNESEYELADENVYHEEIGNVNENKDEPDEKDSKKELARNEVDERNWTDKNQNPNEELGRNNLEEDKVKPDTEVDIAGDLSFNESENKLADENGNHEGRGNVNENKNSKKELARRDMDERNRTDENQNPNKKLGRNSLEEDKVKQDTKADTEKQNDQQSSYEGYKSPFKKKKKLYE